MKRAILLSTLMCVLAAPAIASADQVRYVGLHPVVKAHGGGICHIEAPHVHIYSPAKTDARVLYRDHDEHHMFIGDPVAYGYVGARSTYNGHHPIHVDATLGVNAQVEHGDEFCYIDGPHFHAWAPPATAQFELKGGVHWYVGTFPPRYKKQKKRYARINVVVAPIEYERPVITIEPPSAWVGIGIGAGVDVHGGAGAAVGVGGGVSGGIAIEVPPPPTIEFGVGVSGGVGIGGGHRHRKHRKHRKHKRSHKRSHRSSPRKRKSSKKRRKSGSKFRW